MGRLNEKLVIGILFVMSMSTIPKIMRRIAEGIRLLFIKSIIMLIEINPRIKLSNNNKIDAHPNMNAKPN